jgi:thiamine pyrophosphate-dependent acetolactate synthase large subunit-like protein
MVRDFIKWDDLPISLPHFAESAVRAYKIAMTPPMMPVLLVLDGGLQEDPIDPEINARLRVPRLTRASAPQAIRARLPRRRGCWSRRRTR